MQEFLDRFRLEYVKFSSEVLIMMILIWLVTIGCAISSIMSQPYGFKQRMAWIALVIGLPGIGMLAYLPFSFRKEDMPHIFMRKSPRQDRRSSSRSSRSSEIARRN